MEIRMPGLSGLNFQEFSVSDCSLYCTQRLRCLCHGWFSDLEGMLSVMGVPNTGSYSDLQVPLAEVWWFCGKWNLLDRLPAKWSGTCVLV